MNLKGMFLDWWRKREKTDTDVEVVAHMFVCSRSVWFENNNSYSGILLQHYGMLVLIQELNANADVCLLPALIILL